MRERLLGGTANRQTIIHFPNGEREDIVKGIYSGTMKLNRILNESDNLQYGECNAAVFEAQITGISDLSGTKIYVYQKIGTEILPLFTGIVDSCKAERNKTYRKLTAYDELYFAGSRNVASWYESLFTGKNSYSLKAFRDSFFAYLGIEQEDITLVNDDITLEKTIETDSLKASEVMYAICQVNACFGTITPEGKFRYVMLGTGKEYDVSDNLRNTTSYEEYVTKPVDKLMVLSDEDELNVSVGSGANTYTIRGNFLLYGFETENLRKVAERIYQKLKNVVYRPADICTVLSEPNIQPGDMITVTDNNVSFTTYVLEEYLSGTQLLRQELIANGKEEYDDVINDVDADIKTLKLKQSSILQALQTEYLKSETAELRYATIDNLTSLSARIDTIVSTEITVEYLKNNYAQIDFANIEKSTIGTILADVGLITSATIVDGHVTGYLDSVSINANNITVGTISVDRLIFRGSEKSIVYELNNITGALQTVQGDTLNGEILTPRTITADRIVANAITATEMAAGTITADKLNVSNIFGNSAVLQTITSAEAFIDAISTNSVVVGANTNAVMALSTANAAKKQVYHTAAAGSGKSGYFKIAQIKIEKGYQNQPIKISVVNRGNIPSTVWITFTNVASTDPGLSKFAKTGTAIFYIHKADTSTWDLYVKKAEAYDYLSVTEYDKAAYMSGTTLTWTDEYVAGLPAGVSEAKQTVATAEWCYNNDITYIDGGNIYAGTITAEKINATTLSAITANLGTVTAGIIQSTNYVSGTSGMQLNLSSGVWDSKNFKIASDGSVNASNLTMSGGSITLSGKSAEDVKIKISYDTEARTTEISPWGIGCKSEGNGGGETHVGGGYISIIGNSLEALITLQQGAYGVDLAADSISLTTSSATANITATNIKIKYGQFGTYANNTYSLVTDSFICNSWIRTVGSTGWYSETYKGGWYMSDTTWIRAHNNKNVYTSGTMYAGKVLTTSGADLDTVNANTVWRTATVSIESTYASWYGSYSAKYRYDANMLEICVRGTIITKTVVAEGQPLCKVSGLAVAIPSICNAMLWDDTAQVWRRVALETDGYIKLASNTSIPASSWLSTTTLNFYIFRT